MPQDFFADGFGQEQGVVFTKEEGQFLQKKIPFLDPRNTYQIFISNVLSLLSYARLDNETIKKILQNSCKNGIGQKTVTYDQMKKIFRGVALKQNKIQPSKINIQANIKTNLPMLYDDDSQEQQPQQKPKPVVQKAAQKQSIPLTNQSPLVPKPQPQQPQQQPVDPLKVYDDYWKSLKTKGNTIDGGQVKKLCSNNNTSKNSLSKAWKLCNISEKGSLSKGEFFIFMNLINSNNIPQCLTKQMKEMIHKIQQSSGYKKSQVSPSNVSQVRMSTSSVTEKPRNMAVSDVFDKFGDQSLFQKNSPRIEQAGKNTFKNNASNIFSNTSLPPVTSTPTKNALLLVEKSQNIIKQVKSQQKQILNVAQNNQQMASGLVAVQQYLITIQQGFSQTQNKIISLKQSQNTLNQRLNSVCLSLKNIITQQSQYLGIMMQSMSQQNQTSLQRLKVLQQYTNQMSTIIDSNLDSARGSMVNVKKQQSIAYQDVRVGSQRLRQKVTIYSENKQVTGNSRVQQRQSVNYQEREGLARSSNENYRNSDPFDEDQHERQNQLHQVSVVQERITKQIVQPLRQQQPVRQPAQEISRGQELQQKQFQQQMQQQQMQQQQMQRQQMQQPQSQEHIDLQNATPQLKMKIKQMQLIKMVNCITPIKQQQYHGVVQRITSMTDQQMNILYAKLYQIYTKKQQEKAQQEKNRENFPNVDEFNTSQFIDQKTLQRHNGNAGNFFN